MDTALENVFRDLMRQYMPFESFRPLQEETILAILESYIQGKKYVILEAPTGIGKSVIAYVTSKVIEHMECPTYTNLDKSVRPTPFAVVATHSRMLQQQYEETLGVPSLWAGSHYPCALYPDDPSVGWGDYQCGKEKCPLFQQCEYVKARTAFYNASFSDTNYAYLIRSKMRAHCVVIDEAHNLEEMLCEWAKVSLSDNNLRSMFGQLLGWRLLTVEQVESLVYTMNQILNFQYVHEDIPTYQQDLREACVAFRANILGILSKLGVALEDNRSMRGAPLSQDVAKEYDKYLKFFESLYDKLTLLVTLKTEWVLTVSKILNERTSQTQISDNSYIQLDFKPMSIVELSQQFFRCGNFFLLMSGTILGHRIMTRYLGIGPEEYTFIQLPHTFPVENRKFYAFANLGSLSRHNKDTLLPIFVDYMDKILFTQFPDQRGIIHTVSYENAQYIQDHSHFSDRMVFPRGSEHMEIVELLQQNTNTIIVSPAITEGLDLRGDLCRFVIFFKVPYAHLLDKWVKKRLDADKDWYYRNAALKIVQGSGRGTRDEEDYSSSFMFDGQFARLFYYQNKRGRDAGEDFFPQWFREAVEFITI